MMKILLDIPDDLIDQIDEDICLNSHDECDLGPLPASGGWAIFQGIWSDALEAAKNAICNQTDDWLPIESAPKSGESILVRDAIDGTQAVVWFDQEEKDFILGTVYDGDRSDIPLFFTCATHWRPLL